MALSPRESGKFIASSARDVFIVNENVKFLTLAVSFHVLCVNLKRLVTRLRYIHSERVLRDSVNIWLCSYISKARDLNLIWRRDSNRTLRSFARRVARRAVRLNMFTLSKFISYDVDWEVPFVDTRSKLATRHGNVIVQASFNLRRSSRLLRIPASAWTISCNANFIPNATTP